MNRATNSAFAALIAGVFLLSFATLTSADRASNTTYAVDYEMNQLAIGQQMNSTSFNVTPGGAIIGGQMNSTSFNVSFGILAGSVETTTTTTTTTAPAGGTGGSLSYSTSDNRVSGITVDPGANVSLKAFINTSISLVNFIANRTISGGAVAVKKIEPEKLPPTVSKPAEKVFEFIEVSKTNILDESLRKVKIKFSVSKAWLTENNIPESQIVLQRFETSGWRRLPTQKISGDDKNVNYESDSPGLSVFAISALPEGEAPPATIPEVTATTAPTATTSQAATTTTAPSEKPPVDYTGLVIAVVLILSIVAWHFMRKK